MTRLTKLAPLAVAALVAGCGSSSASSTGSTGSGGSGSSSTPAAKSSNAANGQLSLSESEFKITPASPSVAATGTIMITVKNTGKVTHALSVQTPAGIVRTGDIAPGAVATLKVNASKAGRYAFFCPIDGHRGLGMSGVLVVGSGAAATGSGASATTSSSTTSGGSGKSYGGGSGY